jgi:hypothetical protein
MREGIVARNVAVMRTIAREYAAELWQPNTGTVPLDRARNVTDIMVTPWPTPLSDPATPSPVPRSTLTPGFTMLHATARYFPLSRCS